MDETESRQRDSAGRFVKGNVVSRGHGRRPKQSELDELKILTDNMSLKDWANIVCMAKRYAEAGDARAREWLWERMFGKVPVEGLLGIETAQNIIQEIIFKRPENVEENGQDVES